MSVLLVALAAAGCGERDATPELRDAAAPEARQTPAAPAPATQAPPTTPSAEPGLAGGLPQGVTAQMVQEGQRVFAQAGICYTCHGANGEGGPLGPALNDPQWIHLPTGTYEEILNIIRTGVAQPREHAAAMPPMGGASLSEEQLRAVAAYVYALSRGVQSGS